MRFRGECTKKLRQEDTFGANFDEILETLNHTYRRKSRQPKRRGRKKGFKKRLSPEITRKLGDATLSYATGHYDEEALYNMARAYHIVGHYTLAASYYEKVLAIEERDSPMPKLPNENPSFPETLKPGYCNLHNEAAYNLHLIYKRSGALDLARQVLKNYCSP